MKTFDDIEIRRPALARTYMHLLDAQPGRTSSLFASRRVGKTFFLDHDLAPEAKHAGWVPVYADVWLHKASPLKAINHALEEALDDVTIPAGAMGKIAKTPVKKVSGMGASVGNAEKLLWYSSTCSLKPVQTAGKNTSMMPTSGICLNTLRKRWTQVSSWTSDSTKQHENRKEESAPPTTAADYPLTPICYTPCPSSKSTTSPRNTSSARYRA